jgi:hypothetical protein
MYVFGIMVKFGLSANTAPLTRSGPPPSSFHDLAWLVGKSERLARQVQELVRERCCYSAISYLILIIDCVSKRKWYDGPRFVIIKPCVGYDNSNSMTHSINLCQDQYGTGSKDKFKNLCSGFPISQAEKFIVDWAVGKVGSCLDCKSTQTWFDSKAAHQF